MTKQMIFKRYETKYVLDSTQRLELMAHMRTYGMEPDEWGMSTTRSLYLDTPTWILARRSLEHPRHKEKLRIRSYTSATPADKVFFELKKKFNGIVYKRRCVCSLSQALALLGRKRTPQTQIEREISYACARFSPLSSVFWRSSPPMQFLCGW